MTRNLLLALLLLFPLLTLAQDNAPDYEHSLLQAIDSIQQLDHDQAIQQQGNH